MNDWAPGCHLKYRYLIKHQGQWKFVENWAAHPEWDDEVTDVIWLKNHDSMIANWWLMKNGRRYITREVQVKDDELTFLLLQVEA